MMPYGLFRAGTSGLVLSEPNKKAYPPEFHDKSRLAYYASRFNTIEINSSFYRIPRCRTYTNWSVAVPPGFQFTVKLWRGITHEKEHDYVHLESFFAAINCLADKKGCLLVQFPAKTKMDFLMFKKLMEALRRSDPNETWRLAIEFRDPVWYQKHVCDLLDEFNASLVLHDMPKSIPKEPNTKAPFVYIRFHGEKGDYRGSYEDVFLMKKADQIRIWLKEGKDVYAYFNNTIGAAAVNLKTLKEMIME
ncbi:MAG TPA: DUF72 domain-containing protein [Puia sp.]|jgi:uncharacterized protein YecE (DUF72 family)